MVDLRPQCSISPRTGRPHPSRPRDQCRYRRTGRDPADHRASDPGRAAADVGLKRPSFQRRFLSVPRPYTITRTGFRPGVVALTFDDGPDPRWTPRVLDILKAKQVPATFFVVGENALTERGLLKRMISEGHEVGSHTYTHPNLATTDKTRTLFELNATQRLFQAFTGRTLKLFRAPFFGDAEPTTADEILPVGKRRTAATYRSDCTSTARIGSGLACRPSSTTSSRGPQRS